MTKNRPTVCHHSPCHCKSVWPYYARIFMKSQGHIVTERQTREIKVLLRKTKLQI